MEERKAKKEKKITIALRLFSCNISFLFKERCSAVRMCEMFGYSFFFPYIIYVNILYASVHRLQYTEITWAHDSAKGRTQETYTHTHIHTFSNRTKTWESNEFDNNIMSDRRLSISWLSHVNACYRDFPMNTASFDVIRQ